MKKLICIIKNANSKEISIPKSQKKAYKHGYLFMLIISFACLSVQVVAQDWEEKASLAVSKPSSRYQHSMTYDSSRNVVVLFGGMTEHGPSDETWEWDGTTWTQRASGAVPKPSGRYNHAMAYDSNRNVVVLFGGTNDLYFDETWEWDGTSWTQKASGTASKPGPRTNHAMAFDSRRNVVILFGGYDRSIRGYPNDTWVWDGSTWTQKNLETKPSGRMFHSMAYNSDRNVVVLFGGYDKTYSDETWEWNGSSWSQVAKGAVTRPSARWKQAMVFDKSCNTALMFGGESGGRTLNDTWFWDGKTWSMKDPTTKPPARIWHKMAYDSERNVVVMFGGFVNNSLLNDTWEYSGDCKDR